MDVKLRIKELMDQRGWTVYELAKRMGVAPSGISNLYKRNNEPSINTLETMCAAFGISMAQFFDEGEVSGLNDEQRRLLGAWDGLNAEQKDAIMQVMRCMKMK
jgi:transcriptional regulator with XRE-family HTH domain